MGMFDLVRCGTRLDDRVTSSTLFQTKDLDCCLETYWIDPVGVLWKIDENGTYDIMEENEDALLQAQKNREWLPPFYPVPNGKHGRVVFQPLTRSIRIYPQRWERKKSSMPNDWPEYELTFRQGELILVQTLS